MGSELVRDLHGMFAFALCDLRNRRLVLARDRLGIKPLYMASARGGLAFSSAIRSLLDVGTSDDPDSVSLVQYLRYSKVPEPRTAYRDVRALLPGHVLVADLDRGTWDTTEFGGSRRRVGSTVGGDWSEAEAR